MRESNLYFKFKNTNYGRYERVGMRNIVEKDRRMSFFFEGRWWTASSSVPSVSIIEKS